MRKLTAVKQCRTCGNDFTIHARTQAGIDQRLYCDARCQVKWRDPALPQCAEDDCVNRRRTRNQPLCDLHYSRLLARGTTDLARRVPTGLCFHCGVTLGPKRRFYCSEEHGYLERHGYSTAERKCKGCLSTMKTTTGTRKRVFCTDACADNYRKYQRYGLTPAAAEALNPVGVCQICGGSGVKGRWSSLVVDHCHDSDVVRGIICSPCNVGIGMFQDNPELLTKAAAYLRMSLF